MNITIIGAGYVGLISAICFANNGHKIICVDHDIEKINLLNNKIPTIYENNLEPMLIKAIDDRNIEFTSDIAYGVKSSEVIILAVGTPEDEKIGETNLEYIFAASNSIADFINEYKLVITKSTVPIGTNNKIKEIIEQKSGIKIDIASNPEFMREGFAIEDFLKPDRIVVGVENEKSKSLIEEIYASWILKKYPLIFTDIKTAELIKYAANGFLMTKIAFINEIDNLCQKFGCNIKDLTKSIGLDHRIGSSFLNPGPGIGGSCFPKDASALVNIADKYGINLTILEQVIKSNNQRFLYMANKIKSYFSKESKREISVLGLAFKADTDDIRMSPAIAIIKYLLADGFKIFVYDPKAMENSKVIFGDEVEYCLSTEDCHSKSKHIAILTEWNEFKKINKLPDFNQKIIIDLRNIISDNTTSLL